MSKLSRSLQTVALVGGYRNLFQFCVSVHHIIISKNTSLMQLISIYFTYSKSLHVSGRIAHHQENMILYISATGISPLKLAEEASRG